MKFSNLLRSIFLGISVVLASTSAVDGQGLFNRKKNITPYQTSSAPSAPQESAIFKSGQPEDVEETSYYIQDGVKVRNNKKPRLFGKILNRGDNEASAPEIDVPAFETAATTPAPTPVVPTLAPTSTPAPEVAPEMASTTQTDTSPLPTSKRERRFGLPNLPLPNLPRLRKDSTPVDPGRAEVLVNQGGTLAPSGADLSEDYRFKARTNSSGATTKAPPKEKDGSIVYNSWDDVVAKKTSAADLIVKDMKAQEAAHKRKVEAAKREYEEKIKKAQADARIRAIMQGAVPPGGF